MSRGMTSVINNRMFFIEPPQKPQFVHAVGLFFLTILFLYVFRPIEISDNSLSYIWMAESRDFFYPPHLLHVAIIYGFNLVFSNFPACDIACAGMIHSMVWGAITIASIYLIAGAVLGTTAGAILPAMTVMVAHGFWVYATQLEVYVPSVGSVTAATAVLLTNRAPTLSMTRIIAVSVLWAVATTYHVANVFLLIPFCVYFCGTQGVRGLWQLAIACVLAGGLVLAAFVVAYLFENEAWSFLGFLPWVFALTNVPMTEWGQLSHWQPAWLFRAGWRQIIALTLLPEYLTSDQRALWLIGSVAAVTALLWNLIQAVRPNGGPAGARIYFLSLFAVHFLFFAWWQPMVHKFYIPSSIPLIMLMAIAVRDLYVYARTAFGRVIIVASSAAVVVVIFVFNLSSVLELRRSLGPYHAEAEVLDRLAPEGCTIYSVGHHLNPLRVYFDRTNNVSVRRFLSSFYAVATDDPGPERLNFDDEECALMPLGFLSQEYYSEYVAEYLGKGRWPDYVGYFFDLKADPETGGVTHDAFEVVAEGDGPPHVLVDRGRRVHAGSVDELTGIVSAEVDRAMARYAPRWPDDGSEPNLAYVPRANVELGRSRREIFGYSFGDSGWRLRPADQSQETSRRDRQELQ